MEMIREIEGIGRVEGIEGPERGGEMREKRVEIIVLSHSKEKKRIVGKIFLFVVIGRRGKVERRRGRRSRRRGIDRKLCSRVESRPRSGRRRGNCQGSGFCGLRVDRSSIRRRRRRETKRGAFGLRGVRGRDRTHPVVEAHRKRKRSVEDVGAWKGKETVLVEGKRRVQKFGSCGDGGEGEEELLEAKVGRLGGGMKTFEGDLKGGKRKTGLKPPQLHRERGTVAEGGVALLSGSKVRRGEGNEAAGQRGQEAGKGGLRFGRFGAGRLEEEGGGGGAGCGEGEDEDEGRVGKVGDLESGLLFDRDLHPLVARGHVLEGAVVVRFAKQDGGDEKGFFFFLKLFILDVWPAKGWRGEEFVGIKRSSILRKRSNSDSRGCFGIQN